MCYKNLAHLICPTLFNADCYETCRYASCHKAKFEDIPVEWLENIDKTLEGWGHPLKVLVIANLRTEQNLNKEYEREKDKKGN